MEDLELRTAFGCPTMTARVGIDPNLLIRVVKSLRPSIANYYGMSVLLLREVIEESSCPLTRIVNTCLSGG